MHPSVMGINENNLPIGTKKAKALLKKDRAVSAINSSVADLAQTSNAILAAMNQRAERQEARELERVNLERDKMMLSCFMHLGEKKMAMDLLMKLSRNNNQASANNNAPAHNKQAPAKKKAPTVVPDSVARMPPDSTHMSDLEESVATPTKTKSDPTKCKDCQVIASNHQCVDCGVVVCSLCCQKHGLEGVWMCSECFLQHSPPTQQLIIDDRYTK